MAHGHQVLPFCCLQWRKGGAHVFAPNCRPGPCYTLSMVCVLQGTGVPEHVLLSTANILLLFVASSPGQAQESGERNECRHVGESHTRLLGRTPAWRTTSPMHTSVSRNAFEGYGQLHSRSRLLHMSKEQEGEQLIGGLAVGP